MDWGFDEVGWKEMNREIGLIRRIDRVCFENTRWKKLNKRFLTQTTDSTYPKRKNTRMPLKKWYDRLKIRNIYPHHRTTKKYLLTTYTSNNPNPLSTFSYRVHNPSSPSSPPPLPNPNVRNEPLHPPSSLPHPPTSPPLPRSGASPACTSLARQPRRTPYSASNAGSGRKSDRARIRTRTRCETVGKIRRRSAGRGPCTVSAARMRAGAGSCSRSLRGCGGWGWGGQWCGRSSWILYGGLERRGHRYGGDGTLGGLVNLEVGMAGSGKWWETREIWRSDERSVVEMKDIYIG